MADEFKHLDKKGVEKALGLLETLRTSNRLNKTEHRLLSNAFQTIEKERDILASFFSLHKDIDALYRAAVAERDALLEIATNMAANGCTLRNANEKSEEFCLTFKNCKECILARVTVEQETTWKPT